MSMRRVTVAAVAAVVVALTLPAAASAHPRAERSTPTADVVLDSAPPVVAITFSEDVEPVGAAITVTGPSGGEVSVGSARRVGRRLSRRLEALDHGSYLVRWQVVGDDTHPARGAFLFSVGTATRTGVPGEGDTGTALQALARWLSVGGMALGFGVPFLALVAGGAVPAAPQWRVAHAGIVLMLVAEPVGLLGQTATLAPGSPFDPDLAGDVIRTSYGHTAALRLGVALGLWALAAAARESGRRGLVAVTVLGGLGCLVQAASLHRIETIPLALGLALGGLHVGGACVWLAAVLLALRGTPATALAPVAGSALLVAIVTGSGLGLAHLGSLSDLVQTGYGVTLVAKVVTVGAAIALAGLAARRRGARRVELAAGATALVLGAVLATLVPPL